MVDRVCLWFPDFFTADPLVASLTGMGIQTDVCTPPKHPVDGSMLTFIYVERVDDVGLVLPNCVYVTPDDALVPGASRSWLPFAHSVDELLILLLRWDRAAVAVA